MYMNAEKYEEYELSGDSRMTDDERLEQRILQRKKKSEERKIMRQKQLRRQRRIFMVSLIVLVLGVVALFEMNNQSDRAPASDKPVVEAAANQQGGETEYASHYPKKSNSYTDIPADNISSEYGVLLDVSNNTVIAGKRYNEKIYPASMTKVMTLIIAVENIKDLQSTWPVNFDVLNYLYVEGASVAGFSADENVTAMDLLYGLILPSGADAAMTLADMAAGSQEEFVELMNKKCEELELKNTHFCNTTGLHDDEQYTTPLEMAMIMKYAMENEVCAEVLSAESYTTQTTDEHPEGITLYSAMFSRMYGDEVENVVIRAGKTGYTDQAGNCLVSCAQKSDNTYVCVTAQGGNKWHAVFDAFEIYGKFLP